MFDDGEAGACSASDSRAGMAVLLAFFEGFATIGALPGVEKGTGDAGGVKGGIGEPCEFGDFGQEEFKEGTTVAFGYGAGAVGGDTAAVREVGAGGLCGGAERGRGENLIGGRFGDLRGQETDGTGGLKRFGGDTDGFVAQAARFSASVRGVHGISFRSRVRFRRFAVVLWESCLGLAGRSR